MGTMLRGLLLMPFLPGENVKFLLNLVQHTHVRTMQKRSWFYRVVAMSGLIFCFVHIELILPFPTTFLVYVGNCNTTAWLILLNFEGGRGLPERKRCICFLGMFGPRFICRCFSEEHYLFFIKAKNITVISFSQVVLVNFS